MSSQPPTLPPSMIAGASAQAKIDQIMVRIINLPENIKGGTTPTKISGTVSGQNSDGTLNIKTDKGDVRILLNNKGNLPQGLKIDIEIPAGRNPQQASIKSSDMSSPPPTLQQAVQQQPNNTPPPIPQKPAQQIESETLGKIITSSQTRAAPDIAPPPIPIAGGALQAGQMIRLLPIPPADLSQELQTQLAKPLPLATLVSGLVDTIENLPVTQNQLRLGLIQTLSRLDFSGLQSPLPNITSPLSPLQIPLMMRINAVLQSAGLPPAFVQTNLNGKLQPNSPLSLAPAPQALSLFNPSKSVDGQVLSFQPINSAAPVSIPSTQPSITSPVSAAQVLGATQSGLPVLSIPLPHTGLTQIYTMQFGANNIKAGTPVFIALDPTSVKNANSIFIQSADGLINLNQPLSKSVLDGWINSGTWDSLDDLLKNMTHIAPANAHSFSQMIPNPVQPNSMGALSLFFLSLIRSGDTDGWVANEAIGLLRQMGKSDLMRHVTSDLSLTSKIESLSLPQDWRLTLMPMLWENQIHKLPVYYKHMPDDGNKEDADAKKRRKLRFLFDLNLSRMGGVQVDGFMQSERLDIILRTKSPLSPPMQSQMKKIYAGAMDKSRLTGDLSFQFKPEHWVDFGAGLAGNPEKTGLNA
jgi:hypothetical protein